MIINLGANDIKDHRFLSPINFANLLTKKLNSPFKPIIKCANDTSNFEEYQAIKSDGAEINSNEDPFLKWG